MKVLHVLILACVLGCIGRFYFNHGFPYTHDGENHLARFANYKIALKEGQFPPRFAPNLYNHYGYPVFNFNYPLANILSLPFSFFGVSYELTFKLLALFLLGVGLVGFSTLMRALQSTPRFSAVLGAAAWVASPYVVQLLYVRGSIGELAAFGLTPWLLWSVEHTLLAHKKGTVLIVAQTAVIWAAFFLSHNSSVLFVTPVILALTATRMWQTGTPVRRLFPLLYGFLLGLLSSSWFWIPALMEQNTTVVASAGNQAAWMTHFATFHQLLFSPPQFGFSFPGSVDSLGLGLGVPLVVGLVGAISLGAYRTIRARNGAQAARVLQSPLFAYGVFSLSTLAMQLPMSRIVWEILPFVRFIQFPWRLMLLLTPLAAVIWALLYERAPKPVRVAMFVTMVWSGVQYAQLRPVDYFHRQTIDYDLFSQSTSTQNENRAATFTYQQIANWQPAPTVITGAVIVRVDSWTGSSRTYDLTVSELATIVEPTMLFPGWQTMVSDQTGGRRRVEFVDSPEIAGRLAFRLEPGTYRVHTTFTQRTPARIAGNTISAVASVGICVLVFTAWRKRKVDA